MTATNGNSYNKIVLHTNSNDIIAQETFTVQVNKNLSGKIKPTDAKVAKYNYPHYWETKEFTLNEFAEFLANGGCWRPAVKVNGNTKADIAGEISLVALDFDDKDAFPAFHYLNDFAFIHHYTLSYSEQTPWKQRLIFKLDRPLGTEEYEKLLASLLSTYDKADGGCNDAGRLFFGSNQPVISACNVTLSVEDVFEKFPAPVKKSTVSKNVKRIVSDGTAKSSKKSSKKSDEPEDKKDSELSPCELIYKYIFIGLDLSLDDLYCLHEHNFKLKEEREDGFIECFVGSNPFSSTNKSGTSFAVGYNGHELPVWFDKSGNASTNEFTQKTGGSFLRYWYQLHPDFAGKGNPEKMPANKVLFSIFRHFKVIIPSCFRFEHLKDLLRYNLQYPLRFNLMGDIIEYNGSQIIEGYQSWLSAELGVSNYTIDAIAQCIEAVARENSYHPFIEKLESISKAVPVNSNLWNNLSTQLLDCDPLDPKNELYTVFLQKLFLGVVARVLTPGIKFDTVLVLQGKQGLGKSSWFREIVGRQFFSDSMSLDHLSKDMAMVERRAVLHELAEIDNQFNKRELSGIKAMITQPEINVRLPYARQTVNIKRSSVFVGSVNGEDFLLDKENRRYMVIPVKQGQKFCYNHAIINAVWSTAYSIVKQYLRVEELEEVLTIPEKYWELTARHNNNFEKRDVLEDIIAQTIETRISNKEEFHFSDLLACLYPGQIAVNRAEQNRCSEALRALGYEKKQKRQGEGVRVYLWVKTIDKTIRTEEEILSELASNKSQTVEVYQQPELETVPNTQPEITPDKAATKELPATTSEPMLALPESSQKPVEIPSRPIPKPKLNQPVVGSSDDISDDDFDKYFTVEKPQPRRRKSQQKQLE